MRLKPLCQFCDEQATFLAAQSADQGKTVTWAFVCGGHFNGWNEGGDWLAPAYKLVLLDYTFRSRKAR